MAFGFGGSGFDPSNNPAGYSNTMSFFQGLTGHYDIPADSTKVFDITNKYNTMSNQQSNLHFIKVPCHQSTRKQGYQFGPDDVKEKYDYEIKSEMFNNSSVDTKNNQIKICLGYDLLYSYILKYSKIHPVPKYV